eukprot:1779318-Amphidinium_carterae.1
MEGTSKTGHPLHATASSHKEPEERETCVACKIKVKGFVSNGHHSSGPVLEGGPDSSPSFPRWIRIALLCTRCKEYTSKTWAAVNQGRKQQARNDKQHHSKKNRCLKKKALVSCEICQAFEPGSAPKPFPTHTEQFPKHGKDGLISYNGLHIAKLRQALDYGEPLSCVND